MKAELGRPNAALLGAFGPSSMVSVKGMAADDPHIGLRNDICQLADDRRSTAQKMAFVHEVLRRLGLAEAVTFHRLDPEGFDHVVVAGERYRIPNGLEKFRDRMIRRCPEATTPLRGYFDAVGVV